ncbi:MAG TPA: methylated-DNA--[protein]-cysteine S-methyltransferase, partial [Thermoanaerobaculia bacterium]|nr:methylated-DNA--[protein]-cysteine S-methyltransferase [Thermoanaerobaculia bacterium]
MNLYAERIPTPLPELAALVATVDEEGALVALDFLPRDADIAELERRASARGDRLIWESGCCAAVAAQLAQYFAGERQDFDLQLAPRGSAFQREVWDELYRIPYGVTISYAELAQRVGRPGAARAVGRANGTNPIPVIIPCHRVIGADGSLTGYGGGMPLKRALLALE